MLRNSKNLKKTGKMKKNNYSVVFSSRKTLSLQVKSNGQVVVRAPYRTRKKDIERFVSDNADWLERALTRVEKRRNNLPEYPDSEEEILKLKALAKQVIPPKVEYYSALLGVKPERVSINRAKSRFGSCSAKNTLNFSCFLMLFDERAVDYVVVHELCHIKEKNHSPRFYALVASILPDYKQREKILKG